MIGRGERLMLDFTERVCTKYKALVRLQTSNYCDPLNTLLGDQQWRKEYFGRCRICIRENGHTLHVSEADRGRIAGVPSLTTNVMMVSSGFLRPVLPRSWFSSSRFARFLLVLQITLCVVFL